MSNARPRTWFARAPLATLVFAGPAMAAPIISEVAWSGSDASSSDEWVEIYNPGPATICDLSAFALLEGSVPTVHVLPGVVLGAGEVLVIEGRDSSTSLIAPDAVRVAFANSALTNGGEALALCSSTATTLADASCDVANPSGTAWFAGSSTAPRATMERIDAVASGSLGASWADNVTSSAVTDSAGVGVIGTPGIVPFELPPDAGSGPACVSPDAGFVADAGPPSDAGAPGTDAGNGPVDYDGLAITEVYFNPPASAAAVGRVWFEVANLSGASIALDGVVVERLDAAVVGATLTIAGTGITLGDGDRAVIAHLADLDVDVCLRAPVVVLPTSFSLPYSAANVSLRVSGPGFTNTVRYSYGGTWGTEHDGKSMALLADDANNALQASFGIPTCAYAGAALGTPGQPNNTCSAADYACAVGADGGVPPTDGGQIIVDPVDAGPNEPPAILVSEPGSRQEGAPVRVVYTATDPDEGDSIEVELYVDVDGAGADGARVARGLPGGVNVAYSWTPAGVPAGTYRIFARAIDQRGETAYAYAPGEVQVGTSAGDEARIAIVEPDGVNDYGAGGAIQVTWDLTLPADAVGSVALVFDTNDDGEDGTPIAGGLSAAADGPRSFEWTPEGVPQGSYSICAVLTWTRGRELACSPPVNVAPPPACACTVAAPVGGTRLLMGATLAILVGAFARRKRSIRCATASSPTSTATSRR